MLHFPNAKINIGLYVTEKRADAYHNIESVFYPLPHLKDALELVPAEEGASTSMHIKGKQVTGSVADNLVWKAFELLQAKFPELIRPVAIRLLKSIPMGAGLGGGSADATFMLRLMRQYFGLQLSDQEMETIALSLGSDCPFFVRNTPQVAKGRGELLTPIELDLSQYSIQLICPKIHISTASAFAQIKVQPAAYDLNQLAQLPLSSWKGTVENDFERPIFKAYPELAQQKQLLYDEGAIYASMSGSGSTIYGIFEKGQRAMLAADATKEVFYFE